MAQQETRGTFSISPDGPFRAWDFVTMTLSYTVGQEGIEPDGGVKFGLPNQGWGEPLTPYPRGDREIYKGEDREICRYKPCNTTVELETESKADIFLYHRGAQNIIGPYNNWSWWITAIVEGEALSEGDKIIVTYGDTSLGEPGARVQPFMEKDRVWFTAFCDSDGTGEYIQAEGSPVDCRVTPGPLNRAVLTLPSVVSPDDECAVRVSLTDTGMNPVDMDDPSAIDIRDKSGTIIKTAEPDHTAAGQVCSVKAGDLPVSAEVKGTDVKARANPTEVTDNGPQLFWGDLHTHSFYHQYNEELGYGDPCTGPEELLKYARDVSHLDFIALTDGRGALPDNKGWQESQQAVADLYKEGEFVTLKGWEVQMGTDGHRNAIYRTAEIEDNYDDPAFSSANIWDEVSDGGMTHVLEYFKERDDVLLIPHHPGVWMNWDKFDPDLDRLVEIYSCWGSSESPHNEYWDKASIPGISVADGLAKGLRFGFAGGSDSHTGYPGRSIMDADRYVFVRYKAGFTGVWADSLTRGSIWDAIRDRHTYATTGARMIVRFSVDSKRMGMEIHDPDDSHNIRFSITGTDLIKRIDILRDGNTVYSETPFERSVQGEWNDDSEQAAHAGFYYLRATQVDGNRAWASPVFIR